MSTKQTIFSAAHGAPEGWRDQPVGQEVLDSLAGQLLVDDFGLALEGLQPHAARLFDAQDPTQVGSPLTADGRPDWQRTQNVTLVWEDAQLPPTSDAAETIVATALTTN